ncbi:MAG: histidinol dehydrogenase [Desulfarculus sp.]|jgi:histidinol dehydrogenase|nr:MAG: histidinol dehydrogenase [Desulfarculus sp.]
MKLSVEKIAGLSPERRRNILRRSMQDVSDIYEYTKDILEDIRQRGDAVAVEHYAKYKPGLNAADFKVVPQEIQDAYKVVPAEVVEHLHKATANIRTFHAAQLDRPQWQMEVSPGVLAGRKNTPLDSAGCYVPGRRAAYPSSVLMTILPAVVAGVRRVVVTTPPDEGLLANPHTLVACDIAGVQEIYKLGGPWAVGSLAYGTQSLPKVAKIVGPGNKYVLAAKMLVYGQVDIDSPAGPSEALILADATSDPRLLALDFLSQVEHDPDAAAVLVTDDPALAGAVCEEVERIYPSLPRQDLMDQAARYCAVLLAADMEEAVAFTNEYAAEHLQIVTAEPFLTLQKIRHAGSIFLGPWAPVPVGDYASGTNHVLPTGQAALSFSGLSVDDFIKKPTFQYLTREGLASLGQTVITLAEAEGLPIHAMCVRERLKD